MQTDRRVAGPADGPGPREARRSRRDRQWRRPSGLVDEAGPGPARSAGSRPASRSCSSSSACSSRSRCCSRSSGSSASRARPARPDPRPTGSTSSRRASPSMPTRRSSPSPTSNPISFLELALNSLIIASATALVSVSIGLTAAYAFSRMKFRGREVLMLSVLAVLMLPAVATIAPLFVLLTRIQIGDFNLAGRSSASSLAITAERAAVRDLEPEGLPRHDPQGPRGGRGGRRRDAQPDVHQDHRCRWPSRPSRSPRSWGSSPAGPSSTSR